MNIITPTVQTIARAASRNPSRMYDAHRAAEDFHAAMANAFNAESELEDAIAELRGLPGGDAELEGLIKTYEAQYRDGLGRAAAALQKMPVKWAAILSCELTDVRQAAE